MLLRSVRDALLRLRLGPEAGVVVGASGGVDSTVLLRILHGEGVPVVAVHVDYGLRPESAEDATFVSAMATTLGVPVVVRQVALPASGNRQEAAREARYAVFRAVAEAEGFDTVAVGHTATDQAETVLLHLLRGAGQAGLGGMREERALSPGLRLVRPLLGTTRHEVEAFARDQGWTWREDASNATDAYRRNRLRHRVLPLLEEEGGPGTIRRIADAARRLQREADEVESILDRVGTSRPSGGAIPVAALLALTASVQRAVVATALRRWAPSAPRKESVIANIVFLLSSRVGSRTEAGGWIAWRDRDAIVLGTSEAPWDGASLRLGDTVQTPFGMLHVGVPEVAPDGFSNDPHLEMARLGALGEPLELRPWRVGDRFQPLGMKGTVLVSDLLTNRRLPSSERAHQLVLTSADRIVWVVGHRLAEAARVTDPTEPAVSLVWTPSA